MSRKREAFKLYICASLLPFSICILICIRNGVYPFGENCILHIDMYHQYEPFFTEFMDKLKNGGSLLYSFRLGIGSDFVALFAYYLASPLNWLLAFCPSGSVIEFMTVCILLKIGFCGLSMAVYLRNHFGGFDYAAVIFSGFYALSGYMTAYSWNIMWLDCIVLAPLAVLGLERLIKEGKGRLYTVSLALAALSNFYIAIMLCIFLTLICALLLSEELHGCRERFFGIVRFALFSLLAGGMGAVLIFPAASILRYSGSSGASFPDAGEWYFGIISMLERHFMNAEAYTGRDHFPNLYCGSAVFLFLVLYFLNRGISRKKKLGRLVLILFFWAGFANNILDFLWHGLHFPDSLPGRQSYLYIFLLIVLGYEAYRKRNWNAGIDFVIGTAVSFAVLAASYFSADTGMSTGESRFLTGAVVLCFCILLLVDRLETGNMKRTAVYLLAFAAVLELFTNSFSVGFATVSRTAYTKNWDSVKRLLAQTEEMDASLFYRVEEMERLTKNDASVYGYCSATTFSSLMNIGVSRFYRKMGMEGGKNFYCYSGATPISSAMLSVKYLISESPYEESPLRTLAAGDGQNYIYRNFYTLPLGFMAEPDLEAEWDALQGRGNQIRNLNRLASALGAETELLVLADAAVEAGTDKTIIEVKTDGYLYGTYTDTSVTNLTVTNQERVRRFNKCDHGYILDLGWCRAGDVIEITNSQKKPDFWVQVYQLNLEALDLAYGKLNEQVLQLDSFSDTEIEGHIEVKKSGNLLVSIPKEDGWSVFVDGEETDCGIFMDSLMKIPLIRGEHQIRLCYRTPGLRSGAAVSLVSLFLFVLVEICRKFMR